MRFQVLRSLRMGKKSNMPRKIPTNLFTTQTLNGYYYTINKDIRLFIEAKSKRLTSKTFIDNRFISINYKKLHLFYSDVQTIYKRLLIFGDAKVYFKHLDGYVIIQFKRNDHVSSFLGMFVKRLIAAEDKNFDQEIYEIVEDMETIFKQYETQYIDVLINSFNQLRV